MKNGIYDVLFLIFELEIDSNMEKPIISNKYKNQQYGSNNISYNWNI